MRTCFICGQVDDHVHPSLALLASTAERGQTYTTMDRCDDRLACRDRCEAIGDSWPLAAPQPHEPPKFVRILARRGR